MSKINMRGTAALDFADGLYQKIAGVKRAEHPFDRALGIETSQRVHPRFVKPGTPLSTSRRSRMSAPRRASCASASRSSASRMT